MVQDRTQRTTPDLLATAPVGEASPPAKKPASSAALERRQDLPNALKHLSDPELDSLTAASLEEASISPEQPNNRCRTEGCNARADNHVSNHVARSFPITFLFLP
jgi:hypothetical protein